MLDEFAAVERSKAERGSRLAAQIAEARARERRARELLAGVTAHRAALEGEQMASDGADAVRLGALRRQLAEGAPEEVEWLQRDIDALAVHARTLAETRLADGYENLAGRRRTLADTNVESIAACLAAARRTRDELEALKYAERPDLEPLGPFVEVLIPAAQLERARRSDEAASLMPRSVIVPASVAELFGMIGGVSSPRPELSPAELRETLWNAERSLTRRWNSGEAW